MVSRMFFDKPEMLYLLAGIPALLLIFFYAWVQFKKFETAENFKVFIFGSHLPSWRCRILYAALRLLAFSFIIVGLAEPYGKVLSVEPKYKNVRLFFLLDVSMSMLFAEDVKPNRLVAVREEIIKCYKKFDGNYEVGLIPFAGSPNPYYCPLTYSKSVFIPLLEVVSAESAPAAGTDITEVFKSLKSQIVKDKLYDSGVNVVVLLTDGGKEESDASNWIELRKLIEELASKNCRIYTVGVGGSEPAPLVFRLKGDQFAVPVKGEDGKPAYSQLDEEILKQIASQGKGEYLHFEKENQLEPFISGVLAENRIPDEGNLVYSKETFQCYFYATAAVLLWFSLIANFRRKGINGKQTFASGQGHT